MEAHADRRPLLFLLGAFALSRLYYYYGLGLQFDVTPLGTYWQYLDPYLLRHDLWRSLRYLHSQPPLFNLGLGLVLKGFPAAYRGVYQLSLLLCGLGLAVSVFGALRALGVHRWLSAGLAAVYVCAPSSALYEAWLFYSVPAAFLFALAIWLAALYARDGSHRAGIGLVVVLASLALLRASFSPLWIGSIVAAIVALKRNGRRTLLLGAIPPLALVAAVYLNTWATFSTFTLSEAFLNLNIAKTVLSGLTASERAQFVASGKVSRLAELIPFSPIESYRNIVPDLANVPDYGIPALAEERKHSGLSNLNHAAYLPASRRQLRDALVILAARPGSYLFQVGRNIAGYVRPKEKVNPFNDPANLSYGNAEKLAGPLALTAPFAPLLPPLLIACLGGGLFLCLRSWRGRDFRRLFVLGFLVGTLLLVSATYLLLAPDEHCRYRAEIDPGYVILLGLLAQAALQRFGRARPGAAVAPRGP